MMDSLEQSFGFAEPHLLVVLGPIALAVGLCVWYGLHRQRVAAQLLGIPEPLALRRLLPLALFAPLCASVSLARPYWGSEEIDLKMTGLDYMFLVDVSRSMGANDLSPSRIEVAKRKMRDIIGAFRAQGSSNRYGITLFAGESYVFCPLTNDIGAIQQFISWIDPEMITSQGSNLRGGIVTAVERFRAHEAVSGRVLLVSDGEDNRLEVESVIDEIRGSDLRFDVLGVGTPEGGIIPQREGALHDRFGNEVVSRLNEGSLQTIAATGGGTYVRSTLDDRDVERLVASAFGTQVGDKGSHQKLRVYHEIGPHFVALALVGMVAVRFFARYSPLLTLLIALIVGPLGVANAEDAGRKAYDLYQRGEWREAVPLFREAVRHDPENRALKQGLASALFKSGELESARALFAELAASANTGFSFVENEYNHGNTLLEQHRFDDAIAAYHRVLEVNPDDERARHNLRVAELRKEAEELQKPTADPPTPPPAAPPGQGESKDDDADSRESKGQEENDEAPSAQKQPSNPDPSQSTGESNREPDESLPRSAQTPEASHTAAAPPAATPAQQERGESQASEQGEKDGEGKKTPQVGSATPSASSQGGGASAGEHLSERDKTPLSLSEAQAWIESLPDTPPRVMQLRGPPYSEEQPW